MLRHANPCTLHSDCKATERVSDTETNVRSLDLKSARIEQQSLCANMYSDPFSSSQILAFNFLLRGPVNFLSTSIAPSRGISAFALLHPRRVTFIAIFIMANSSSLVAYSILESALLHPPLSTKFHLLLSNLIDTRI